MQNRVYREDKAAEVTVKLGGRRGSGANRLATVSCYNRTHDGMLGNHHLANTCIFGYYPF